MGQQVVTIPVIREVKETTVLDLPFFGKIRGEVHGIRVDSIEVYWMTEDYSSITIKTNNDADDLQQHIDSLNQKSSRKLIDTDIEPWTEAEFNEFKKGVFEKLMNNDFSFKQEKSTEPLYF